MPVNRFDYQSERHCSKTSCRTRKVGASLITSQNDTAPKLESRLLAPGSRLITSQNDTAPKQTNRNSSRSLV